MVAEKRPPLSESRELQPMNKVALSALVIAASGAYVWSQSGSQSDPLLAGADLQTGSIQTLTSTGGNVKVVPREVPFVTSATPAPAAPAPDFASQASADQPPPLPAPATDSSGFAPAAGATPPPADAAPAAPFAAADAQTPAAPVPDPAPAQPAAVTVPLPRLRPPYHQVATAAPTPAPASAPSSSPAPAAAVSPMVRIASSTTGLADGTYRGPVVNAYYGLMQIEAIVRQGRLASIHVLRYPNTHNTSIYINRQALPQLRDEVISAQSARVDIVSGATLSSHAFIQSLGGALRKARV